MINIIRYSLPLIGSVGALIFINLMDKPFGFFKVEIKAHKDMKIPLLQTRLSTHNGVKTVAPLGNWTDTNLSEEIYNARRHDYNFKNLRAYLFEKAKIFSDYVDFLYNIKVNSNRETPD